MGRVEGKVAVITGGGSGIGEACAVRLALEGAAVAVVDISAAGAERVAAIVAAGGRAIPVTADVSDEDHVRRMVASTVSEFGRLDILNALTLYTATQYGREGVRANAILPGLILTPAAATNLPADVRAIVESNVLTPYVGGPDDIAHLVTDSGSPRRRGGRAPGRGLGRGHGPDDPRPVRPHRCPCITGEDIYQAHCLGIDRSV